MVDLVIPLFLYGIPSAGKKLGIIISVTAFLSAFLRLAVGFVSLKSKGTKIFIIAGDTIFLGAILILAGLPDVFIAVLIFKVLSNIGMAIKTGPAQAFLYFLAQDTPAQTELRNGENMHGANGKKGPVNRFEGFRKTMLAIGGLIGPIFAGLLLGLKLSYSSIVLIASLFTVTALFLAWRMDDITPNVNKKVEWGNYAVLERITAAVSSQLLLARAIWALDIFPCHFMFLNFMRSFPGLW